MKDRVLHSTSTVLRRLLAVPALGLAMTLSACSSTIRVAPLVGDGQSATYESGVARVGSARDTSVVFLKPLERRSRGRARLLVTVKNTSANTFDLLPETIAAQSPTGQRLRVIHFEELAREQEAHASRRQALAALSMFSTMAQGAAATAGGGLGQMQIFDPGSAMAFAESSEQDRQQVEASIAQMEKAVLQRSTVRPGAVVGGYIVVEVPQTGPFTISIPAGGDVHVFTLDAQPA